VTSHLNKGQLFGADGLVTWLEQSLFGDSAGGGPAESAEVPSGPRMALSCRRCGEWLYAAAGSVAVNGWGVVSVVACPICDGELEHRGMVGADGHARETFERVACNEECQSARGVICTCRCGGRNHGVHRYVTVTVDHGRVTLSISDGRRLARLRARTLPDLERSEQLEARATDLVDARYADIRKARESRWLDPGEWASYCRWGAYRDRIRATRKLKLPASRVRKLAAIVSELER
jgi:hypothetical protein